MSMLLLLLACSTSTPDLAQVPVERAPDVTSAAPILELTPPAAEEATGDAALPEVAEDDAERISRIADHCSHLQKCGCADGQSEDRCNASSMRADLPASVYRCTSSLPCEMLCQPVPGGTSDKGLTPCVLPYVKSQIEGGPSQGPAAKGRTTTHKPLDDRAKKILSAEKAE
ncbi:MAG: hypothetical protein ACI9VR_000866 [Cognaticolwellia sp.]|jgi:hypothetical protein